MTEYQRIDHQELNFDRKLFDGKNIEIVGKIDKCCGFIDYSDYFSAFLADLHHSPSDHNYYQFIEIRGDYALWNSPAKKVKKAYDLQLSLSIRGVFHADRYIKMVLDEGSFDGAHLCIHEVELLADAGSLSLTNNLEGKLSLTDKGKLSFIKKLFQK